MLQYQLHFPSKIISEGPFKVLQEEKLTFEYRQAIDRNISWKWKWSENIPVYIISPFAGSGPREIKTMQAFRIKQEK